jgi:hypothetical protein
MAIIDSNNNVSFAGRVVKTYVDPSFRIMSDVWADIYMAVVYSPETKGTIKYEVCIQPSDFISICLGNSEFGCDKNATVDAPQELMDLYAAHLEQVRLEDEQRKAKEDQDRREREHKDFLERVQKGRVVRVFKGRKVPIGIQGYVFWEGVDSYGVSKVGIATTTRKERKPSRNGKVFDSYVDVVFVAASNCKVVGDDEASIQAAVDAFLAS